MRILGIESSCDETGVAIYDSQHGLLADTLYSQVVLHQQYGGVVPELASRDHVKHLVSLVDEALNEAGLQKSDLDLIAYTAGPGLVGALLSGASFAKSLAYGLNIPALAVHHLEAHLLAALLDCKSLAFPFLVLLVSGGHTQLIEAQALGQYRLLGDTLDDAVGEAFDKTAKIMGIPYPGGAALAKLADEYQPGTAPLLKAFPCPMINKPGLEFSFSGLKTHALTVWQATLQDEDARKALAYAFQKAVVTTLVSKCQRALQQTGLKNLVVAGGVGANRALRTALQEMTAGIGAKAYFPQIKFCTDNGAMVAFAGCLHALQGHQDADLAIDVRARWPFMVPQTS